MTVKMLDIYCCLIIERTTTKMSKLTKTNYHASGCGCFKCQFIDELSGDYCDGEGCSKRFNSLLLKDEKVTGFCPECLLHQSRTVIKKNKSQKPKKPVKLIVHGQDTTKPESLTYFVKNSTKVIR